MFLQSFWNKFKDEKAKQQVVIAYMYSIAFHLDAAIHLIAFVSSANIEYEFFFTPLFADLSRKDCSRVYVLFYANKTHSL